ncbi:EAL domain-containing protein [Aurantiacibacter atlanticus]|nr:EAL domain-containing protein [Aurantiacibacter atlanticus]
MVGTKPTVLMGPKRLERLKHVFWAGAISLVLATLTLLTPIDQFVWMAQSRIVSQPASGDIVFISSEQDLTAPDRPEGRRALTQLLRRLDEAGARAAYIDGVFDRPTNPVTDDDLNTALRQFSGRAFLVQNVRTGLNGKSARNRSIPAIADGVQQVGGHLYKNFMGYAWDTVYVVEHGESELPSLAAHLAGIEGKPGQLFPISYNFSLDTIPSLTLSEVLSPDADLSELADKSIVVGSENRADGANFNIPGLTEVSPTLVHVLAAETLKTGQAGYLPAIWSALCLVLGLALASQITSAQKRRLGYAAMVLSVPVLIVVAAHLDIRTGFAHLMVMLAIFGGLRLRKSWAKSFALVDPETDLPTFAALEADREIAENVPAIIVARIHRFEQVRRTLPKELHSEYVLRITSRLKAATQDATIYLGQGHLIAWTIAEKEPALLLEHLEGLRALFSSPLMVGDQQVDVGITFGVDITPSPMVARRLASAVDVAEKTNETFEPIAIADSTSEEDLIWNISLQARIDAAMANGEIYLVYQPKVTVQTGEIVGVEALVRWKDPDKGHIPPDSFIRQCETAGRMSQLTKFVLEEACKAGKAFEAAGLHIPVAVNISATLVHERAIVQLVSKVLSNTDFDARRLTLEITETYRISNLEHAGHILEELSALGIKISMDDFGVGAASLEALLRLPFSELKVDRLFISQMAVDTKAEGIVRNVLQLGRDLRIIVVAEGVEDSRTLTKLRESGCLVAQGFAISRPVDIDSIIEFQKDSQSQMLTNMV